MQHTSLHLLSSLPELYMQKKAFFNEDFLLLVKDFVALHNCSFSEI